jgi:hypothetical protein
MLDKVLFAKAFENKHPPCTGPQYDPYYFELMVACNVTQEPNVLVNYITHGLPDIFMVHLSVKMDNDMEDDFDNEIAI